MASDAVDTRDQRAAAAQTESAAAWPAAAGQRVGAVAANGSHGWH
jgi:hypothetical protein